MNVLSNPNSLSAKFLVGWYGLFQIVHFIFNGLYLLHPGTPPFPPPAKGWSSQTVHLLNGIAATDFINALLSLVFVYGYFTRAKWRMWLGTLTLTISVYAATVFTYGTIAIGAWNKNLWGYLWSYIPFIPVLILFSLVSIWTVKGNSEMRR